MRGRPYRLARDGAVATVRLDRARKHNILGLDEADGLIADLERLDGDDALRVLVLTGSGARTFSAGVDLGDVLTRDWSDNPLARLADRIEAMAPLTVCALNGSVYGGASDLALACDFRIGVEGLRLVMPPAKLGVVYHESGLRRHVERLGPQRARRLFLAAEEVDARTLLEWGYLDRLVEPGALASGLDSFVSVLAAHAPRAVRAMKRALLGLGRGDLDSDRLRAETLACFASEDAAEGIAAHRAKRPPVFTGR